jgi:hypothetical protein
LSGQQANQLLTGLHSTGFSIDEKGRKHFRSLPAHIPSIPHEKEKLPALFPNKHFMPGHDRTRPFGRHLFARLLLKLKVDLTGKSEPSRAKACQSKQQHKRSTGESSHWTKKQSAVSQPIFF